MAGRLLTAREVADQLGVSAETVLRWMRRRELPAFKLPGGAVRFREEELRAWLERRSTTAGSNGAGGAVRSPLQELFRRTDEEE